MNVRSFYEGVKGVKGVKGKVIGGFGISACWGVDGGVGTGNDSADIIIFRINDGYDIGYNDIYFYGCSVGKPLVHI